VSRLRIGAFALVECMLLALLLHDDRELLLSPSLPFAIGADRGDGGSGFEANALASVRGLSNGRGLLGGRRDRARLLALPSVDADIAFRGLLGSCGVERESGRLSSG
jgi:hypothetical protein